jgi:hypothetical protein
MAKVFKGKDLLPRSNKSIDLEKLHKISKSIRKLNKQLYPDFDFNYTSDGIR